ncbi:MAG: ABC transporter ATP-binding protein [Aerococcus sp.]|nr:ABC transporter ATP-binding protein [Aerococcus sp.]
MIEISHLRKKFGKKTVLNDVSFTVNPGEVTCLIGVNGTGKTTIMNAIMQLIKVDSGNIQLDGQPLTYDDFNRIAYVPDAITLLHSLTIEESLDYMATYYESFSKERASQLLEFFRFNPTDRIDTLSKGNVAKANILVNLALDADYFIMDEPFSGIDIFTREEITRIFTDDILADKGVLISTHEIQDIEFLIDKAILLDNGQVVKTFYPEEVRQTTGQSIEDVMREVYHYA